MTGVPPSFEGPEELRALDAALRGVRFEPRASLGPELAGRARQEAGQSSGGRPGHGPPRSFVRRLAGRRWPLAAAALVALVVGGAAVRWVTTDATIDRCCFDLDGGGEDDDGVILTVRRGEVVRRLALYEDRDGSRSMSDGDPIRFTRGAAPTLAGPLPAGLVTTRVCCTDYDGGGPGDDGLLVVGLPPDRVVMVALYEQRPGAPPARLR